VTTQPGARFPLAQPTIALRVKPGTGAILIDRGWPSALSEMAATKGTLYAVFFYVRYGASYRDLEAIMEERGVKVDHSTLNRWVINYSSSLEPLFQY
jgi:hypothetical protein